MKHLSTLVLLFLCYPLILAQKPVLPVDGMPEFIDSLFQKGVAEGYIPGGIVGAIHQNKPLQAKAYGLSDLEANIPASFEHTRFQLGSVGKVLTAITVLMEVEKGNLDLDRDVNEYLTEFQIKAPATRPVTLRDILTQSAGFNERVIGYAARSRDEVEPLGEHLKKRMPQPYTTPGTEISYSNYGFGLAGHLVELSSGLSFQAYVKTKIFEPLEMETATYRVPEENEQDFATGYYLREEFYRVKPVHRHVVPAGSVAATGADLMKFTRALLNEDSLLLTTNSYKLLKTEQFSSHPLLTGNGFGTEVQNFNGHLGIGKAGGIPGFLAYMMIFPEHDFGIFTAVNTQTDNFLEDFTEAFKNEFFVRAESTRKQSFQSIDLSAFSGEYRENRYNRNTIEDAFELFAGSYNVYQVRDSALWCYHNGKIQYYKAIDELVFQNTELEDYYLVFSKNESDEVIGMSRDVVIAGVNVPATYEKVPWYLGSYFINEYYAFIPLFVFTFLLLPFFWLIIALIRRKNKVFLKYRGLQKTSRIAGLLFSLMVLVNLIGSLIPLFRLGQGLLYGVPKSIMIMQGLSWLLPILLVIVFYRLIKVWVNSEGALFSRIYFSVFALASLTHVLFLHQWHFIGLNI